MRRADREITDPARVREIIAACHCCRLGLNDEGRVYIVPLNFGFTEADGKYTFYFHSAPEGRKLDILRQNPSVGFEMDTGYALKEATTACGHSARYQSVIGTGRVTFAQTGEEKRRWLMHIMEHNTGRADWDIPEAACQRVSVFRLEAEEFSCKEHE